MTAAACPGCEKLSHSLERLDRLLAERLLHAEQAPLEQQVQTFGRTAAGAADASGNLTLDLGAPVAGSRWEVEIVSKHAASGSVILAVCVGPLLNSGAGFRRAFSAASADDVLQGPPSIAVNPGDHLTLAFTGSTSGVELTSCVQFRVIKVGRPQVLR